MEIHEQSVVTHNECVCECALSFAKNVYIVNQQLVNEHYRFAL